MGRIMPWVDRINASLYKDKYGQSKYLSLSSSGAAALRTFLRQNGISCNTEFGHLMERKKSGGQTTQSEEITAAHFARVKVNLLREFILAEYGLKFEGNDQEVTPGIQKLFAEIIISPNALERTYKPEPESSNTIYIDLDLLDYFSDPYFYRVSRESGLGIT